jgi:hypothetical protein
LSRDSLEPVHVRPKGGGNGTSRPPPGSSRGIAISVRPTARPEPLSVWAYSALPCRPHGT